MSLGRVSCLMSPSLKLYRNDTCIIRASSGRVEPQVAAAVPPTWGIDGCIADLTVRAEQYRLREPGATGDSDCESSADDVDPDEDCLSHNLRHHYACIV